MARQPHKEARYYAVLIGINAYSPDYGTRLKGCVRDVEEITKELRKAIADVNIYSFTATVSCDPSASQPIEPNDRWPTYDNISFCLNRVTKEAQAGDYVYIHFSGHSTEKPQPKPHSDGEKSALALVVLDGPTASNIRYLHSIEIAEQLRDFVGNGVMVTVVLDCCYSGSTLRKDEAIRYLPYCTEVDKKYPLRRQTAQFEFGELEQSTVGGLRGASLLSSWVANPKGYAILTSSDASEEAYEVKFSKSEEIQRHGTLTYFLLETFDILGGVGGSMDQLSESIRVKIMNHRRYHPNKTQNPVLLGNRNQLFFGCHRPICQGDIPVTVTIDQGNLEVLLHAGEAHGISKGDRFALHQLSDASISMDNPMVIAETVDVRGISSDLRMIEGKPDTIETGWLAKAITRFSLRQFSIRLDICKSQLSEWQDAIEERQSLVGYKNVAESSSGGWSFLVVQKSNMDYEIRDESGQIIAAVSKKDSLEWVMNQVLNWVQHLALFKLLRCQAVNAENKNGLRLPNLFKAWITKRVGRKAEILEPGCTQTGDLYGTCFHKECVLTVTESDTVHLLVENKGYKNGPKIYAYVYAMGTSKWEIEDILKASREGITPMEGGYDHVFRKRIRLSLDSEEEQCEDIIKVFLTIQPTSFTMLTLPELGSSVKHKEPKISQDRGSCVSEEWAVVTFRICTTR
jgi:hypothetical protein